MTTLRRRIDLDWRGRFTELARRAGTTTRTIRRLLHVPGYNPTLRTYDALVRVVRGKL